MVSRWHDLIGLVAFLVLAALAGATIAWPLWWFTDLPWDKVLSRSVLLCAALLVWPLLRYLSLDANRVFGRGWSWRVFIRYWLIGLILIAPPAMVFLLTGFRVFDHTWHEELDGLAAALVGGLFAGVLAAMLEETVFRGVFFLALHRVANFVVAATVSSALYALCHFLRTDFDLATPGFFSGYEALGLALAPLASPALWWDSFVGLFLLGLLLCMVRVRTESLLPCIALHAAWIFFLRAYKELTGRDIQNPWAWLVGEHDNFTGIVVAGWLLVLIVIYLRSGRRASRAVPAPASQ